MVDANPAARPFPVVAGVQHAQKILQTYLNNHAHETYPFVANTEAADLAGALYSMLEEQNNLPTQTQDIDLTKVPVTGEMVELAVEKAGASFIPLRECSICRETIGFRVNAHGKGLLWFDSSCGCSSGGGRYESYAYLAGLVNTQKTKEHRNSLRARFFLPEEAVDA